MPIIFGLDITFTNWINTLLPHNRFFDLLFSFFSLRGGSVIIWMAIVALLVFFEEKVDRKFVVYLVVALGLSFLITTGLKAVVQRPRPTYLANNKVTTCDKDFSFPSGHATIAFASAVILAAFDKKRKYIYYAIAVLISISRIYLHCHYLLDVITGAAIGTVCSMVVLKFKSRRVKIFS